MEGSQTKNPIEALSREELIQKYKGLLGIAKKAKQAKDELVEENKKLKEALASSETQKEADKKALMTMKETLEQFTENKLQLTSELNELQRKSRFDEETMTQLRIENESLKRQLDRLNEDNEALLSDIDRMEDQLKQVNLLGMEQKKHLGLLELEVNKLKEAESLNSALKIKVSVTEEENRALKEQEYKMKLALEELTRKYDRVKAINTEQRQKFNALKQRFVELHRKVKKLKECKEVLLETQHEYADAVSKWQREIIKASRLLCSKMNAMKSENDELLRKLREYETGQAGNQADAVNVHKMLADLQELQFLSTLVLAEQQAAQAQLGELQAENTKLKEGLKPATETDEVDAHEEEERSTERDEFERQNLQIKRLTQELDDLNMKLECRESLAEELSNLQREKQESEQRVVELMQEIALYKEQFSRSEMLEQQCTLLQGQLNAQSEQLTALEYKRDALQSDCDELGSVKAEKTRLESEVEGLTARLSEQQNVLKTLEKDNESLLRQLQHNSNQKPADLDEEFSYEELRARYAQKEREHADLLCEMRELNEALKARGDVISRQQEKQQELMAELRKTNARLKQIDDDLKEKDEVIAQRTAQVQEINAEIATTRQKVSELEGAYTKSEAQIHSLNEELQTLRNADCQSEVLSTSTMSRGEELARMREVDESFEEKYNKLRGLAMKLKKKLQEQTAYVSEMEQQQTGHNALKQDLDECRKQLAAAQSGQEENTQLIETLKAENQKLKSSRKQANVLNLEIEAAERGLSEATTKLAAKTSELETLNEALTSKEHSIVQLRKEIAIVESAKAAECAHSKELKEQIDRLQEQIKDAVHSKQESLARSKELEHTVEQLKLEIEERRLQVALSANTTEATLKAAQNEKEQADQKLVQTETLLSDTQTRLKAAERALEDLRVEYLEYKVKAQAVLRKNQNKDSTRERELEEELTQLRAAEQQMRTQAQTQAQRVAGQEQQLEQLRIDNDSLQRRVQDLMRVAEELRQQNEALGAENRAQLLTQQEVLKTQRQQLDNVDALHKQQLADMEARNQWQLEQLRSELSKLKRVPPTVGANATSHTVTGTVDGPSRAADMALMEREDAEGSEEAELAANHGAMRKISTASLKRTQHDFMPLEELLNAPMHAISDTVTTISGNNLGRTNESTGDGNDIVESMRMELQVTKERLQKQESRVRHLTALLAENEQDLAKLTQMNDMLKEEVRRQERAVEREQHMHNSEYLKNVIMKFLTLNNGDERMRLVPVLITILKLSRNETEVLNLVAKGQKVPSETQGRGWSSFLPTWGGSGGGANNNNNSN